jgi:hypothetical protein
MMVAQLISAAMRGDQLTYDDCGVSNHLPGKATVGMSEVRELFKRMKDHA